MIAHLLRLDPVLVLRDPNRENFWIRSAAANAIQKKKNEANKKK